MCHSKFGENSEHGGDILTDILTAEQQPPLQLLHIDDRYPALWKRSYFLKKKHIFGGEDLN